MEAVAFRDSVCVYKWLFDIVLSVFFMWPGRSGELSPPPFRSVVGRELFLFLFPPLTGPAEALYGTKPGKQRRKNPKERKPEIPIEPLIYI